MLDLLKTLHTEFTQRLAELDNTIMTREVYLPDDLDKVTVAIGMRRTGKSYALFLEIQKLLKKSVVLDQILYIDFEDDRLQPFSQQTLAQLLDAFYSLYPENHGRLCYLFLDEIQMIPEWPLVIRRFLNTKKVKIYLTGSSAKLLSKEIATSMRGRALTTEVWPYSFKEYLTIHHEKAYIMPLGQQARDKYTKLLHAYLLEGGFPEVVNQPQLRWMRLLQDYVEVVTYRDIIERYNITNLHVIKYMISYLIKNAATSFSVNKFHNDLKSQGFSVGRDTVSLYLSYIEDAFLIFSVPLYSESVRKTQVNPKKCYTIDTGMIRANQLSLSPNWGRIFENLIYLDLRRRGDEIYYYLTQDRYEVDFFTRCTQGKMHLYQVVWNMDDTQTVEREMRALKQAENELGITGELISPESYFGWLK